MAKLPSLQFYPGDWRKDPSVQSLSYHDRGVWFEILLMMFESCERGKLLLNGRPMPDDALARLLGLDKQILTNTLTKLIEYGVASRDPDSGALVCKRMARDEEIRKVRAKCGKLGGNPHLLNQTSNQNATTQVKVNPTPSSSSSSSSSPSGCEDRANRKRYADHQEVMTYAKSQPFPISEECVDAFFDRMEEIGWTDDRGLPLADWRARFRRYATNWSNNSNRPNGRRTA